MPLRFMYLKQHFVDFQVVCSGIVQKLTNQKMELQEVYIHRHRIHLRKYRYTFNPFQLQELVLLRRGGI